MQRKCSVDLTMFPMALRAARAKEVSSMAYRGVLLPSLAVCALLGLARIALTTPGSMIPSVRGKAWYGAPVYESHNATTPELKLLVGVAVNSKDNYTEARIADVLPPAHGDPSSTVRQQQLALPLYVHCLIAPNFRQSDRARKCGMLHDPTDGDFKSATDKFRQSSRIQVDQSHCEPILDRFKFSPSIQGGRQQLLKRFQVALRPRSSDHDVFLQAYCGGPSGDFGFMAHLPAYMRTNRPVSVLDAGANIGVASMLFAQLIGAAGEVLAVEPHPETYKIMASNLQPFRSVVRPVKTAIVAHDLAVSNDTIAFSGDNAAYWGFRVDHSAASPTNPVAYQVDAKSLPMLQEMMASRHFDFIKIDIEGEEKRILKDPRSVEVLCGARCLFMELHDRVEPGCASAWQEFLESGCNAADKFDHIVSTGEHMLYCKTSLTHMRSARASHW